MVEYPSLISDKNFQASFIGVEFLLSDLDTLWELLRLISELVTAYQQRFEKDDCMFDRGVWHIHTSLTIFEI